MPALPQWLNIDPLASVPRMLQGYATGAQIGESLRQGEQRTAEHVDQAAQFSAELAQRQAAAERTYQLHQEAEQEKAKMAARNMVGMQEYQALVASGFPKDKALMQAAPNLFYGQSDKLPNALHQLSMEQQAAENALRMDAQQKAQETNWLDTRAETMRHHKELEQGKPATPKLFHVGNSLIRVNPDDSQETLFTSNDPSKIDQWQHTELMAQLNATKQLGIDSPEYKQAKSDLENFTKGFRSPSRQTNSLKNQVPQPMPKSKAALKIGTTYITRLGPAVWDGSDFVEILPEQ